MKRDGQIAELLPSLQILSKELGSEIQAGKLQISMGARGLIISFTQAALFPSGEDEIAKDFYPGIQKIANAIQQVPNPVRLEGHTDSVPIHNSRFKSNWDLSAARSIALLEYSSTSGMPAGAASPSPDMPTPLRWKATRPKPAAKAIGESTWSCSIEPGVKGEPERMSAPAQKPEAARQAGRPITSSPRQHQAVGAAD